MFQHSKPFSFHVGRRVLGCSDKLVVRHLGYNPMTGLTPLKEAKVVTTQITHNLSWPNTQSKAFLFYRISQCLQEGRECRLEAKAREAPGRVGGTSDRDLEIGSDSFSSENRRLCRYYCGWTKSCTSWKPWETTVCWYLQGNHLSRAS